MARKGSPLAESQGTLNGGALLGARQELGDLNRIYAQLTAIAKSEKQLSVTFTKIGSYLERVNSGQDNISNLNKSISNFIGYQNKAGNAKIEAVAAQMSNAVKKFTEAYGRTAYSQAGSSSRNSPTGKRKLEAITKQSPDTSNQKGLSYATSVISAINKRNSRANKQIPNAALNLSNIAAFFQRIPTRNNQHGSPVSAPSDVTSSFFNNMMPPGRPGPGLWDRTKKAVGNGWNSFKGAADPRGKGIGGPMAGATKLFSILTGTITGIFKILKRSSPMFSGLLELFEMALMIFFLPIGNGLAKLFLPFVTRFLDLSIGFMDWADRNMPIIMVIFGAILGGLTGMAVVVGLALLAIVKELITANMMSLTSGGLIGILVGVIIMIVALVIMYWDEICAFLGGIWDGIKKVIGFIVDGIVAYFKLVWELIKTIVDIIIKIWTFWIDIGIIIFNAFLDGLKWLVLELPGIIWDALKGIGGVVDSTIEGIPIVGDLYKGAKDVFGTIGGWLGFSEGGYVQASPGGTMAVIGEGGEGEWIIPDSKMAQMVNGGGSSNEMLQVNFYGPVYGVDDLEIKIDRAIDRKNQASRFR